VKFLWLAATKTSQYTGHWLLMLYRIVMIQLLPVLLPLTADQFYFMTNCNDWKMKMYFNILPNFHPLHCSKVLSHKHTMLRCLLHVYQEAL